MSTPNDDKNSKANAKASLSTFFSHCELTEEEKEKFLKALKQGNKKGDPRDHDQKTSTSRCDPKDDHQVAPKYKNAKLKF